MTICNHEDQERPEIVVCGDDTSNYQKEKHFYIYLTTNLINGKKYIGKRMCTCRIEDDTYLGSGKILKLAINTYKKENFSKQILEVCDNYVHCNEREKYWIWFYNAVEDDTFYNIASGGEGGDTYSGLTKEELLRINEIKSNKSKGKNNPMYGTTWTPERREKIINALRNRYLQTHQSSTSGKFGKDNKLSKTIICIETNIIYCGIREASRITGIPSPNIIKSIKSNGKFAAGKKDGIKLHWKEYTEEQNESTDIKTSNGNGLDVV